MRSIRYMSELQVDQRLMIKIQKVELELGSGNWIRAVREPFKDETEML